MNEENQENFQEWLVGNLPYNESLNQEEINELKELYRKVNSYQKITNNIMNLALHHNTAEIDYGNDYQKALNDLGRANMRLETYKQQLDLNYNFSKDNTMVDNLKEQAKQREVQEQQSEFDRQLQWEKEKKEREEEEKFTNWMNENISYNNELTAEEINELKELYKKVDDYQKITSKIMDLALHHNTSGIDYGNDYQKALNELERANIRMDDYKKQLELSHCFQEEEKSEVSKQL